MYIFSVGFFRWSSLIANFKNFNRWNAVVQGFICTPAHILGRSRDTRFKYVSSDFQPVIFRHTFRIIDYTILYSFQPQNPQIVIVRGRFLTDNNIEIISLIFELFCSRVTSRINRNYNSNISLHVEIVITLIRLS